MATTIGRVEFIVGLDGKKLAAEANRLGDSVADSGGDAGDKFGKNFESSFNKRLSSIGKNFANEMRKTGDLAGESLGTSIERKVRNSFQRMQDNLAEVLSDDEAFKKYALGFDSVDDAVKQLEADMGELHKANRVYRDEQGRMRSETYLLKKDMIGLTENLKERAKVTQESIDKDKEWAAAMEQLDASITRTLRTIGSTEDFEKASKAVGGTAIKYKQLRDEIDGLRDANKLSIVQYEKAVDTLDRTREKVDASAKATRDAKIASDEAAEAATRLDRATADLGRTMGDSRTFKERVNALGSLSRATREAQDAIDNLKNLGASETRIEGLERKLKGLHDEFDAGKDRPNRWMRIMDKVSQKVSASWMRMDGTVKLVIGTILSAGPEVAALGSAVGSGLVAVGGAATSMIIGVAGAVAVLKNLNQELSSAPDAMKPAIRSFQLFKDSIGEVSDVIAQAAFDSMGDSFVVLAGTVKKLEPALGKVGTALGKLTKGFAEGTKEGTAAFKEIQKAIENTGPNLEKLGAIAGKFGTALLRAFNGAQPMVEQMFGWLGKLADRFDAFTKDAEAMDEWISNGMRIWTAFGGVIDAVGSALSNLVTPDAVDNTVKLLENLERLAPSLGNLLAVFGALDPIGLLVDIFADIGEVLAPLTPMLIFFAQALNNIVEAVPPAVWVALAAGIALVAAKLVQLKVASLLAPAFDALAKSFGRVFTTVSPLPGALGSTGKKLGALGKAGVVGLAIAGFAALVDVTQKWARSLAGVDDTVKRAVQGNQTLLGTIDDLSLSIPGLSQGFSNVEGALDGLSQWNGGNFLAGIAQGISNFSTESYALNRALGELDKGMKGLPLEDQAKKFSGWAKELNATDAQVLEMIDSMPEFKKALEDAAMAEDGVVDSTDLVRLALGRAQPAAEGSTDAFADLYAEMLNGKTGAELQADALERLTGKSLEALDAVEGVTDGIKSLGSAFRDQQGATISYEAALDDVSAAIEENGRVWDVGTEAGRANQQAVMDLAQSTLDLAAEQYNLTGSATDAAAAIQTGRDAVIKAVDGMDLGGLSAEEYADKLGLIPGDVETVISANTAAGMEMADAFATRLYELGLIEVNPVVALDTAEAAAAAAVVQGQLDSLVFDPFTAILDADGDGVDDSVAIAEGKVYDFASGEYIANLGADATNVNASVDGAMNDLTIFSDSVYKTNLDADNSKATTAITKTEAKANSYASGDYTGTLNVDNTPANVKTDATVKKLDAVGKSTTTPKIDADAKKVNDKTKAVSDDLLKLDRFTAVPKIDVNNTDALNDTQAVKNKMDGLKNKTVYIDVVTRNSTVDKRAAGGIAVTPTMSVWGEAGPEALVPLNRPLSQVDASVRWLSAVAQGKMSVGAGDGQPSGLAGNSRPSKVVNIEPGAIVVQGSMAPEATATNVVNRIAERIGS